MLDAVTILAVGVASLTGSRSLALTAVIGWQTAATTLLFAAACLGPLRQGLLSVALSQLPPGPAVGTRELPGSSNALPGPVLPMSTTMAGAGAIGLGRDPDRGRSSPSPDPGRLIARQPSP